MQLLLLALVLIAGGTYWFGAWPRMTRGRFAFPVAGLTLVKPGRSTREAIEGQLTAQGYREAAKMTVNLNRLPWPDHFNVIPTSHGDALRALSGEGLFMSVARIETEWTGDEFVLGASVMPRAITLLPCSIGAQVLAYALVPVVVTPITVFLWVAFTSMLFIGIAHALSGARRELQVVRSAFAA